MVPGVCGTGSLPHRKPRRFGHGQAKSRGAVSSLTLGLGPGTVGLAARLVVVVLFRVGVEGMRLVNPRFRVFVERKIAAEGSTGRVSKRRVVPRGE